MECRRVLVLVALSLPAGIPLAQSTGNGGGGHLPAAIPCQAAEPINAVIGDASFAHAFGDARPAAFADETLRITTHLAYVETLLRQRDTSALSPAQQQARAANLDRLRAYREAGVFPRNHDFPDRRRPCFIDRDGRICAVGYLVEQSAGRALAEAINARFQYALLAEMDDEALRAWAARSGLSLLELATIQPGYGPYPAYAEQYGSSCAPAVTLAPVVVADPGRHYGLSYGWGSFHFPSWWIPAPEGAQWIGSAQRLGGWGAMLTLTLAFDLTGFDAATAAISGSWAATPGARILLNGVETGVAPTHWSSAAPVPFAIGSGFMSGRNELRFLVPSNGMLFEPSGPGLLVTGLGGTAKLATSGAIAVIPDLFDTGIGVQGEPLPAGTADLHYRSDEGPLRAVGRPFSGNQDFAVTVGSVPHRLVLLALSHGTLHPWPELGNGCVLLIDPAGAVAQFGMTDAAGVACFPLPLPALGPWWSSAAFAQAAVEDPASLLGGLSLTQGLMLFTGI